MGGSSRFTQWCCWALVLPTHLSAERCAGNSAGFSEESSESGIRQESQEVRDSQKNITAGMAAIPSEMFPGAILNLSPQELQTSGSLHCTCHSR